MLGKLYKMFVVQTFVIFTKIQNIIVKVSNTSRKPDLSVRGWQRPSLSGKAVEVTIQHFKPKRDDFYLYKSIRSLKCP